MEKHPLMEKKKIKTSGLRNFREELLAEWISKNTTDLFIGGRRGSLVTYYGLAYRKRDDWWRSRKQVDPVSSF